MDRDRDYAPKATAKANAKPKAKLPAPPAWQAILDTLLPNPSITRRSMFGADGIGLAGKYFAMSWQGALIVKLSRDRVDALVAAGTGKHFAPDAVRGRPMREWLQVTTPTDWSKLVEDALAHCAAQQR